MDLFVNPGVFLLVHAPVKTFYQFFQRVHLALRRMFNRQGKRLLFQRIADLADLLIINLGHSKHHPHRLRNAFLKFTSDVIPRSLLGGNHSRHIHDPQRFPDGIAADFQHLRNLPLRRKLLPRTQLARHDAVLEIFDDAFIGFFLFFHRRCIPFTLSLSYHI